MTLRNDDRDKVMSIEQNSYGEVCQIGFRFVHENLEELQRELRPLKQIYETAHQQAHDENLSEALPDLDVIGNLFQKLEHKVPELLIDCHKDSLGEAFWKEARHDLRACVGGIKSYAELIGEDFGEDSSEDFLRSLTKLIDKANKILPVISKILPEPSSHNSTQSANIVSFRPQSLPNVKGSILIIDDDPQKRNILRRHLESMGHNVSEKPDGESGLIEAENQNIDLILLDIMMPEMSGHEVLDILKQNKKTDDIPVLVISSLSEIDSVVRCIDAGADDYLEMPVDPILLNARVNSCLEKKIAADREKKHSQELARARNTLHAAMESIEDGFAIFDLDEKLVMKNSAFSEMYPSIETLGGEGFSYSDFLKKNLELNRYLIPKRMDNFDKHDKGPHRPEWFDETLEQFRKGGKPFEIRFSDGRWIETVNSTIDSGGVVVLHKDITERKRREQEVQRRADYDSLTGLANRSFFEKSLKNAFQKSSENDTSFAVMFFDLDGFKKVNDDLGHDFGDLVLTSVSEKLKRSLRETDLVARLGGDEFCAIIYNVDDSSFLREASARCLNAIGTYVEKNGVRANFGVSIGIALYPGDANTPEELLSSADAAMYDAKKSGKGTFRFFSEL